jgi:SAM-dependent methyltransferase
MNNRAAFAPLVFLFHTAACQVIGIATVMGTWTLTENIPVALCAGAIVAFLAAHFLALSPPWQILNLVIIPMAAVLLAEPLPAWVPVTLAFVTAIIYAPAFWTRVPYYPTSKAAYAVLMAELPADRPFRFVDIGCGFGDLVLFLAKHRPLGHYTGIEIGILPFAAAKIRALVFGNGRVDIRYQSMWKLDLGAFDVVAFLSPAPMVELWAKAKREMRTGSVFVTNSFVVPDEPSRTAPVVDEKRSVLYFHDM